MHVCVLVSMCVHVCVYITKAGCIFIVDPSRQKT